MTVGKTIAIIFALSWADCFRLRSYCQIAWLLQFVLWEGGMWTQWVGINVLGSLLDLWNCASDCPMLPVWWQVELDGPGNAKKATSGTGQPLSALPVPQLPVVWAFPIHREATGGHPFAEHRGMFPWKMVVGNPSRVWETASCQNRSGQSYLRYLAASFSVIAMFLK